MATTIRANLSKQNPYYISKDRYYELKHFCLQYPEWRKNYIMIDTMSRKYVSKDRLSPTNAVSDTTARCAEKRLEYSMKMSMVKDCCLKADPDLAQYIFKAVTSNLGYTYLKSRLGMPCSKDMYYDRYHKFFWHLSNARK